MINTQLEHVPLKMEAKDEVIGITDENSDQIRDDKVVVNSVGDADVDDDEEDLDNDEADLVSTEKNVENHPETVEVTPDLLEKNSDVALVVDDKRGDELVPVSQEVDTVISPNFENATATAALESENVSPQVVVTAPSQKLENNVPVGETPAEVYEIIEPVVETSGLGTENTHPVEDCAAVQQCENTALQKVIAVGECQVAKYDMEAATDLYSVIIPVEEREQEQTPIYSNAIVLADIPDDFTSEETSTQVSVADNVISLALLSTLLNTDEDSFSPSPKRKIRKRRSTCNETEEQNESPVKRPQRNTRKIVQLEPEPPGEKQAARVNNRRGKVNKMEEKNGQGVESRFSTPPKKTKSKSQSQQKQKEKKPPRNSIKAKVKRDISPPRIAQEQTIGSQISDRDEEFIEQEISNCPEPTVSKLLPHTTFPGQLQENNDAESTLLPKTKLHSNETTSSVDVKPEGESYLVCDQCPRSFKKRIRLTEHKRLHTGEKPFPCDECGKCFRLRMSLSVHKLRHLKERKFVCEICNLGCCTKQDLNMHMRHHNNDRRYQCPHCPKAFVRGSDLKIHVRVHTGEKPYVCDICHKSFSANQNLNVHKKSHMGEDSKNYECEQCEKKFIRNMDRKIHMRTHTGERPFKCEMCDLVYSSRFNLKVHIERDHIPANGVETPPRGIKKRGPKPKTVIQAELERQKKPIDALKKKIFFSFNKFKY